MARGRSGSPLPPSAQLRPLPAALFHSAKEVWARSYAQAALTTSGDAWLERQLEELLVRDDIFVWPAAEFAPVAIEVERVLQRLGLLRAVATATAA